MNGISWKSPVNTQYAAGRASAVGNSIPSNGTVNAIALGVGATASFAGFAYSTFKQTHDIGASLGFGAIMAIFGGMGAAITSQLGYEIYNAAKG